LTRGGRTTIFLFGVIIFVILNDMILPTFFTPGLGNLMPYAVIDSVYVFVIGALLSRGIEENE
jgi:hypothetical protein